MVEGAKVVIQSKSDYGLSGSKRHFEESKEVDFAKVVDMMTLDDAPDMSYVRQTLVWKDIAALVDDVQPLGICADEKVFVRCATGFNVQELVCICYCAACDLCSGLSYSNRVRKGGWRRGARSHLIWIVEQEDSQYW
jgi:hypothetical protein